MSVAVLTDCSAHGMLHASGARTLLRDRRWGNERVEQRLYPHAQLAAAEPSWECCSRTCELRRHAAAPPAGLLQELGSLMMSG